MTNFCLDISQGMGGLLSKSTIVNNLNNIKCVDIV